MKPILKISAYLLFWGMVLWALFPTRAFSDDYIRAAGLIDVRTTFSDGNLTVEALAALARSRGFDAVFYSDHDRMVMEYGLFPFRHLLRKREVRNCIHEMGVENYLAAIKAAQEKYPDMVLVPGAESSPYYYWTGSYFSGDLTAHDHEKRLLSVGLDRAEDYQCMPVLHNGFSFRYVNHFLPSMLIFAGALVIGLVLSFEKKRWIRRSGMFLAALSALLAVNTMPFRSSPFDQYMGDQGIAPYQLYIDEVTSEGGLVFWNYPETQSGVRRLGPISLHTAPYPQVLEESRRYTGFAAIYGDTISATEPGHEWDRVLSAYCRGERQRPVWAVATADFHKDNGATGKLGNYPTVFWVKKKTKQEVLSAMGAGRMVAVFGRYPQRPVLDEFAVGEAGEEGSRATLGQEIVLHEKAMIRFSLSLAEPSERRMKIRLIRAGKVLRTFEASLPMKVEMLDDRFVAAEKTYYRLDVRGPEGVLISNPIFVRFQGEPPPTT